MGYDLTAVNVYVCPAVAMDALESETGKPPSHAAPGSEKQSGGPKYDYDAFATYATDPDGELVRAVEGFVEGFHRRRTLPQKLRRKLELCVDGRDFTIKRRSRNEERRVDEVAEIVEAYMRRCRSLVVFAGPASKDHPWIEHEIRWWLANRRNDPLYFALTHGGFASLAEIQPKALLEAGGGDRAIFPDLRGFYRQDRWRRSLRGLIFRSDRLSRLLNSQWEWRSVRGFEEGAATLVALLLADALGHGVSVAEIVQAWAADERARRRRQLIGAGVAAGLASAAGAATWIAQEDAADAERQARADAWLQRTRVLVEQGGAALPAAIAYSASALAERPDGRSVDVGYRAQEALVPIERIIRPDGGDPAWTAEFVRDADAIATGGRSSVLRLIDLRDDVVRARLDLKAASVRSIVYDEASKTFFVGTDRGLVRVALRGSPDRLELVETGRVLAGARVGGLALDPARGRIVAGLLHSGELWAFPLAAGPEWVGEKLTQIMDPRFDEDGVSEVQSGVYGLAVRDSRLVTTGIDGVVTVFDLTQKELGKGRQFAHPQPVFAMAVSHKGDRIAVADQKGGVAIYDLDTLTLRREDPRPPGPWSVSRSVAGPLTASQAERMANVGLAISGDDTVLAVTSHDHSVRFLTFDDLAPLGSAVNAAAPRGVLFDSSGTRAFTLSDDGSIQVVRPEARPEVVRLAGVGGFVAGKDGKIALWPSAPQGHAGYADPKAPEPQTPVFVLDAARVPVEVAKVGPHSGGGLIAEGAAVLHGELSTRVQVVPLDGQAGRCPALQHSNEPGRVEIVEKVMAGPSQGTVATVARVQPGPQSALTVWDLGSCAATARWMSLVGGAVAAGAVAIVPVEGKAAVRAPPGSDPTTIDFGEKIAGIDVSSGGEVVIARFEASRSVSVCIARRAGEGASPEGYACRRIEPQFVDEQEAARIAAVHLSASGRYAVVQAGSSLRYLDRAANWSVRGASPDRLQSLEQPFAFSADETYLATPAGETDVRIVRAADGKIVTEIPTPSGVTQIAFVRGEAGPERLATLDAGVFRLWDWRPGDVLQGLCERWSPDLAIAAAPDVPPPHARSELCSAAERARLQSQK